MKLRAITMSDIRQFSTPVAVRGIGDGLNVLSAPNESGKSTLFDAILALFFTPHTSSKINTLRPDVGGNPEITLDIEVQGAAHRLHKRWGRGKTAEVWRDGRLLAKGDGAEAFIQGLTSGGAEGGPAGLLWVRQGLTDLEQGTRKEQQSAHDARRDLLSSVTGEFDAMTGGKRMDRALARARADLGALATSRGAKAGGPYDRALKHLEALETRRHALTETHNGLQGALAARRQTRRDLAALTDPEEIRLRTQRLTLATERHEAAQRQADALATAQARLEAAQSVSSAAQDTLDRAMQARQALDKLELSLIEAQRTADRTAASRDEARARLDAAKTAEAQARAAQRAADATLRKAHLAASLAEQIRHRRDKETALSRAIALAEALPGLHRAATTGPDPSEAQEINAAQEALTLALALAKAAAPKIALRYDSAQTPAATLRGSPLTQGEPYPVTDPADIVLPGYGVLHLDPGASADPHETERARDRLQGLLAGHGLASPEQARQAARARQEAASALKDARSSLSIFAPDGVDALRAEVARLAALTPPAETPDPGDAQSAADTAEQALRVAESRAEAARDALSARESEAQSALISATALAEQLETLRRDPDVLADLAELQRVTAKAHTELVGANAALSALKASAPDLAAARAALNRAQDVIRRTEIESQTLRESLAALNARIDAHAGAGVDEELADVTEQCDQARASVAAFEAEKLLLSTLIDALDTAQVQARDRYFTPVLTELRPMLHLLWPGAELRFDGDSLLPSELVRDGRPEPLGSLSGGTREQIALLVRLAFSRLLAGAGTPAPVILDDALVYSDDERIERMFDALHAQASDLQILVFSCRNRTLRQLGGHALKFEPVSHHPGKST